MGGLSLGQHAQLHGVVTIVGVGGDDLLLGRDGPLLLLGHVVVISGVADVGLIECLRIAHLADPISAVSSVQQGAILVEEAVAEAAFGEGMQFFLTDGGELIVLNSDLH